MKSTTTCLLVFLLTLILATGATAAPLAGKVIKVEGENVVIRLAGDGAPRTGDPVKLVYVTSQGMRMDVGTWTVTKVAQGEVTAAPKDVRTRPRRGLQAEFPKGATRKTAGGNAAAKSDESPASPATKPSLTFLGESISGEPVKKEKHIFSDFSNPPKQAKPEKRKKSPPTIEEMNEWIKRFDVLANPKLVALLIEKGASVHTRDSFGMTPLARLTQFSIPVDKQAAVAKLLIAAGADVNTVDKDFGHTPLFNAKKTLAEVLVEGGADINHRGNAGHTPIAFLAYGDAWQTIEYLLQKGARVNDRENRDLKRPRCTSPPVRDTCARHRCSCGTGPTSTPGTKRDGPRCNSPSPRAGLK